MIQGKASTSTDGVQIDGVDSITLRALRIVNANTGVRLTRVENAVLEVCTSRTTAWVSAS